MESYNAIALSNMLAPHPRELQIYQDPNGHEPFTEWLKSIRDQRIRTRIQARLDRLVDGNFGDCEPVGEGISEIRLHFGEVENIIVLLLCGGDKSSQRRDIKRAKTYWQEYKESQ